MKNRKANEDRWFNAVRHDLAEAPDSSAGKNDAWNRLQSALQEERRRRRVRWKRGAAGGAAAAAVVLLVTVMLQSGGQGIASGWTSFMSLRESTDGTVQLSGAIRDQTNESRAKTPPPPPDGPEMPGPPYDVSFADVEGVGFEIVEVETTRDRLSLEQAQAVSKFVLRTPAYVPAGYELEYAETIQHDGEPSTHVTLHYGWGAEKSGDQSEGGREENGRGDRERFLRLEQLFVEYEMGFSIGSFNADTKVKEVKVNGHEGTLFEYRDESGRLVWIEGRTRYMLDGPLSGEELMRVAESMR